MSSYEITAKWVTSSHDTGWYFPLEVTIKNNTNQAVFAPEISFDLSKVERIDPAQPINAYTGFTHQSNTLPVIKGKLAEHLATLPANGSVTVTFGVSFNPAVFPNPNALPEKFTFNGELIGNPEPEPEPEPEPQLSEVRGSLENKGILELGWVVLV